MLKFNVGQIIEHNKFGYRGVIYDADAQFDGSHSWYEEVAKSRPPKDAPWYHEIPTLDKLGLPEVLRALVMKQNGLILVVGSTGSGKSTSLASMIEHRNTLESGHILTIEDPIEYIFTHKKSIIGQREVGLDTLSYDNALREAMGLTTTSRCL